MSNSDLGFVLTHLIARCTYTPFDVQYNAQICNDNESLFPSHALADPCLLVPQGRETGPLWECNTMQYHTMYNFTQCHNIPYNSMPWLTLAWLCPMAGKLGPVGISRPQPHHFFLQCALGILCSPANSTSSAHCTHSLHIARFIAHCWWSLTPTWEFWLFIRASAENF